MHKYAVHLMADVEAVVVPSIVVAPVPGFQQSSLSKAALAATVLAQEASLEVRQTKYYNIEESQIPLDVCLQKRNTSFFLFDS